MTWSIWLLAPFVFLAATGEPPTPPVHATLEVEGQRLDNLRFVYTIYNGQIRPLSCTQRDGGPSAVFTLYRNGSRYAASTDELGFIQVITEITLPPETTTVKDEPRHWEPLRKKGALPAGSYKVTAEPRFDCADADIPAATAVFDIAPE